MKTELPCDSFVNIEMGYADFAGLEHILLGDLRELLAEPLTETARTWTVKVIDMLLDLLPARFAAEEADGYLQEIIEQHPQWESRIAQLQRQHSDLYRNLATLREELTCPAFSGTQATRVRNGLRNWMNQFQSHHDAEVRLLSAGEVPPTLAF